MATRRVLSDAKRAVTGLTAMLGDKSAMRDVVVKPGGTARTSYFNRTILFVKELFMRLFITLHLVSTKDMVADIFTKATVESLDLT